MFNLTKKTKNFIGTIIRHINWSIWSFCLIYLVLDKMLHLPLDFLSNFIFIPESLLNISKMFITEPVESIVPEITVIPSHNDVIIQSFQNTILLLQEQFVVLNNNINNLLLVLQDNNALIQKQLNFQKELVVIIDSKLNNLNISKDIINLNEKLRSIESILQIQGTGQVEIASKVISNIKETNNLLNILDSNLTKPILNVQDTLTQVITNQENIQNTNTQILDVNLQGFNSIFMAQDTYFMEIQSNLDKTFSKIHEIRNHNLEIAKHLDHNISIKLDEFGTGIVDKVSDEINRPKVSSTEIKGKTSWSNFFDKKD